MCGIIAAFNKGKNKQPVNKLIIEQYQNQIHRGEEGFGILFIDKDNKIKMERSVRDSKAIADLYLNPSEKIIFHHRLPSSSENVMSQTHPIEVESGTLKHKYYVIHNGVISNSDERLEIQENELGFHITTKVGEGKNEIMNDSEALAIDIVRFIEGQTDKVKSTGSAAFIALQVEIGSNKALKVFYGRNDRNPLKLAMSQDKIELSSEGKGVSIKKNILYSFDLETFKINKKKMVIPEWQETYPPSKYDWRDIGCSGYNKDEKEEKVEEIDTKETMVEEFNEKVDDIIDEVTELEVKELEEKLMDTISIITNPDNIFSIEVDEVIQDFLPEVVASIKRMHHQVKQEYTNEIIYSANKEDQKEQVGFVI